MLPSKAWICPVCGYIHYGPEPPDECPVCGTEKGLFEPYVEPLPAVGDAFQPAVNQGIRVDNNMRTSHPDVFAAGDVAEHNGIIYGIWPPAQFQGAIAGMNAAGQAAEFAGIPRSNTLKVLGYDLFSIGQINPASDADQVIDAEWDGQYACFIFHAAQMVGSILMGDTSLSNKVNTVIENHVDCSAVLNNKTAVQDIVRFLMD